VKFNKSFALPIFIVLLGGCSVATQGDVRDVYTRQARLEAKTELLSRDVEALNKKTQDLDNVEIEKERIDQLEAKIKQMEQSYADLNERLSQLEGRELNAGLPSPESGTLTPQTEMSSPKAGLYREAYTSLSQGNYNQARQQFKSFIAENPNSPESTDALYWIAESYYREGKFEEAILEFQRFIDTYPKSDKVPLSFLKQGLSLINIGRKEEAKLFLQTLIDKFPQSEEAKIAREKLRELESKG
jgi:tol-pal system protein YbgF